MLTTSSRLISRKKPRHVERGFVADHEQEMDNDIITNWSSNVGLDANKPKPLDFVTLFIAAIAIILTIMMISCASSMVKQIRHSNHFQKAVNIIDATTDSISHNFTSSNTNNINISIATNEEELREHQQRLIDVQVDIAAKQYEIERLRKQMAKNRHQRNHLNEEENLKLAKKMTKLENKVSTKQDDVKYFNKQIEVEAQREKAHFCSDCNLSLGKKIYHEMTCGKRLAFIIKKYKEDEDKAKIGIINDHPECAQDSDKQHSSGEIFFKGKNNDKDDKKNNLSKRDKTASNNDVEVDLSRFCFDCSLTLGKKLYGGMTCSKRLDFMIKKYNVDAANTKATMMKEHPGCVIQD